MFMLTRDEMINEVRMLGGKAHSDGTEKRMSLVADTKNADYVRWLCSYLVECPAFTEKPSKQTADAIAEAMRDKLVAIQAVARPIISSIFDD
jgi:hypothetical protein